MFFLNLSLAEFLVLAGAVSGAVVALYLLDRSRRREVVATLRFWLASQRVDRRVHRRHIHQPWSLALQLAGLLLLLLALAQLRWGVPERFGRDHILILDTSAWMAARARAGTLLDEAKSLARGYLRALPPNDRLMLVRADGLSTPATGFESDRKAVEKAILDSVPSASGLNLERALEFARQAQRLDTRAHGEVVYVGAGRVAEGEEIPPRLLSPALRVLPVSAALDNCGLRKIGLRRSPTDAGLWEILVAVRNYGKAPRTVPVALQFGGAPAGYRRVRLAPGAEQDVAFGYRTRAAGWLEARLMIEDALPEDNRAVLELPAVGRLRVAVYSREPALLRPVLAAHPQLDAVFEPPERYTSAGGGGIVILDRFRPPTPPDADAIWLEPPPEGSPVPVRSTLANAALSGWRSDHPLGQGLRATEARLGPTLVFRPWQQDVVVAEAAEGPVAVARAQKHKTVVLGFHPFRENLRSELSTPLLFANILRWMAPEIFLHWELNAGSAGTVRVPLESEAGEARVLDENQQSLPFTAEGRWLRFFTARQSTVRVLSGEREAVYSLTLPEVGTSVWEPPPEARRGVPRQAPGGAASRDLWQWLALAGGLVLLFEWLWFGRQARRPALGAWLRKLRLAGGRG